MFIGAIIGGKLETGLFEDVFVLLKTYLEMIALRKGPDALPASWLVFYFSVALLAVAWFLQIAMLNNLGEGRLWPAFGGYLLALFFYGAVVYVFGFPSRLLQTLSSIIACGSILAVVSAAVYVVMSPLLGADVAGAVGTLVWFWSVPVKGHVVAQSIQQHWFVGVTIAVSAFIMRIGVETAFAAPV